MRLCLRSAWLCGLSIRRHMPWLSQRSLALAVVLGTLVGAWPNHGLMWATALIDGVGLLFIFFPDTIDDMTFGTYSRGGPIDAHTPSWMISGVGWLLMLLMVGLLFSKQRL
jgi:hypothetical protein